MSFITDLAAARKAYYDAVTWTKPLDPETAATLREWSPVKYAEMEDKVAAIAATLPALRAAYETLDDQACGRCSGTGEYGGASRYTRRGLRFCFDCNGHGKR